MPVVTQKEPTEAHKQLQSDEQLAALIDRHGYLVIEPAADPFRRLVRAIGRQQVSMESAAATWERLTDHFAVNPATLQAADPEDLQAVGLSAAKSDYVKHVAQAFAERGWDRDFFAEQPNDSVIEALTEIHGVGPWTANMFLMFGLGRTDVFPVEDLGIRQAMASLYEVGTRTEMRKRATAWAPYRSIGSLYLWRFGDE